MSPGMTCHGQLTAHLGNPVRWPDPAIPPKKDPGPVTDSLPFRFWDTGLFKERITEAEIPDGTWFFRKARMPIPLQEWRPFRKGLLSTG